MTTSQKPALLSEVHDWKAKIPREKLFYFRARLRQRFYAYLLTKFTQVENDEGLKKSALARRIGKRNEQITRLLGGPNNLELDTISDLLIGMKAELWFTGRDVDDSLISRDIELWISKVLDEPEPRVEVEQETAKSKSPWSELIRTYKHPRQKVELESSLIPPPNPLPKARPEYEALFS